MSTTDIGIRKIDPSEIPLSREPKHGALREWADETAAAFMASDMEAAEVSGWPEGFKPEQVAAKLRDSVSRRTTGFRVVKVMQRKGRIFMQQPSKAVTVLDMPKPAKKRIPMPQSSAGLRKGAR